MLFVKNPKVTKSRVMTEKVMLNIFSMLLALFFLIWIILYRVY
jgi:hypothetical protein